MSLAFRSAGLMLQSIAHSANAPGSDNWSYLDQIIQAVPILPLAVMIRSRSLSQARYLAVQVVLADSPSTGTIPHSSIFLHTDFVTLLTEQRRRVIPVWQCVNSSCACVQET